VRPDAAARQPSDGADARSWHPHPGRLVQPLHYTRLDALLADGLPWAADNDCFQGLDARAYFTMLDRLQAALARHAGDARAERCPSDAPGRPPQAGAFSAAVTDGGARTACPSPNRKDHPTMLRFGYNDGLPDGVSAAWGCRAIVRSGSSYVDVPHDRADAFGPDDERAALLAHLRDVAGTAPFDRAGDLLRRGELDTRGDQDVVLYEDDTVLVRANPRASPGYLYVCAYPKASVPQPA
jgi:hypothetical protein